MKRKLKKRKYGKRSKAVAEQIGLRVTGARQTKGVTQEELASRIGSTKNALSRLENGHVEASVTTLTKIAKGLDIPTALLVP